ncbi:MAG: L,D-transpeptidase family protein [Gemmatimonadota bacterium]
MAFGMLAAGALLPGSARLEAQLPVLRAGARGEAVALLQVELTNREFSPGAIDGRFGRLLREALRDWQRSRGLGVDGVAGPRVWRELGLEPAGPAPASPEPETGAGIARTAFREAVVTPSDTAGLRPVPEAPPEQAQLERLPYETVLERLAERHQTAAAYLAEINPSAAWPNPAPGTRLRVPAVRFETEVDRGATGDPDAAAAGDSAAGASPDSALMLRRRAWEQRAPEGVELRVSTRGHVVRLYEGGKLVARYPATVGSREFPNPRGRWRIVSQVFAPDYRYDERYLETGERSEHALRLPPGPNNLVGLMWMGLDEAGYGLHGTDEPETIGAAESHGCVRLTNWDAERLSRRVGIGTPVTIGR